MVKLALQLSTLRNECEVNLKGTLAEIYRMGFSGVEIDCLFNKSCEEMQFLLNEARLKTAAYVLYYDVLHSDASIPLSEMKLLKTNYAVIPYLPPYMTESYEACLLTAHKLQTLAQKMNKKGLSLVLRNYSGITKVLAGRSILKIFADEAPALRYEINVGENSIAGVDDKALLEYLDYRLELIQLTDIDESLKETELCKGTVNYKPVFDFLKVKAVRWAVIAQNITPKDETLNCVSRGIKNIKERYIDF